MPKTLPVGVAALALSLVLTGCDLLNLNGGPSSGQPGTGTTPSSAKALTAFGFLSPAATGTIHESDHTVSVTVPHGSSVTSLVATFATTGASVKVGSATQVSGSTANDFTHPVTYTVTAADGSTQSYLVTVAVASSSDKSLTDFRFTEPLAVGTIDQENLSVSLDLPAGTAVASLVATFTTTGASVRVGSTPQVSGTTPNNFSAPVDYTVVAADGSTRTYSVAVHVHVTGWYGLGSAGISEGQIQFASLAISASDTPYVAYQDVAHDSKASVVKYNGSGWVQVGSAGFSSDTAANTSLAIDAQGNPWVAYGSGEGLKANVQKFNGTSWAPVGAADFSSNSAHETFLALDPSGTPFVAFWDGEDGGRAHVMTFNGTSWVSVGAGAISTGQVYEPRLAFDHNGSLWLAYSGDEGQKVSVLKFDGTDWVFVGDPGFSPGGADTTTLAFDASGTPWVAFRDSSLENFPASVMKFDGSAWVYVGGAGFSESRTDYLAFVLHGSTPYVAFQADQGNASAMTLQGATWEQVGNTSFSLGSATWTSAAVDSAGAPYVAFSDDAQSGRLTVVKYY